MHLMEVAGNVMFFNRGTTFRTESVVLARVFLSIFLVLDEVPVSAVSDLALYPMSNVARVNYLPAIHEVL